MAHNSPECCCRFSPNPWTNPLCPTHGASKPTKPADVLPHMCQCADHNCPHDGPVPCTAQAVLTLYRVDQTDLTGTPFCDVCNLDALLSGLFRTEDDPHLDEPKLSHQQALTRIAGSQPRSDRRHRGMVDISVVNDLQRTARIALEPEPSKLPTINQLLSDPACSNWFYMALTTALKRDPVDSANDAALLHKVLDARCKEILDKPLTEQIDMSKLSKRVR